MSSEQRLTFICRDKFTPAWCFNQASFAKINLRPMEAVVDDALRPAPGILPPKRRFDPAGILNPGKLGLRA